MDASNPVGAEVYIRDVEDEDLEVFFEHQADPAATRMAAFPAREREEFLAHWARLRGDSTIFARTIVAGGQVAGNMVSWEQSCQRLVGYWIGPRFWSRGIATKALTLFVDQVQERPLYAHAAAHNAGSIRVLQKCGFQETPASAPPAADGIAEVIFILRQVDPPR